MTRCLSRAVRLGLLAIAMPSLVSARDNQSVLSPTGVEAERTLALTWILLSGGTAILLGMCVLTAIALAGRADSRRWLSDDRTLIAGGIVFPVVVLTALLFYEAVGRIRPAIAEALAPVRIAVVGEQWWWRVAYRLEDGRSIETANELQIPVGRPVRLELSTADVIHSFWVPPLSGKLDMIPGRTTVLTLMATEAGLTRGQCAEYCGGAHALMSFHVVAMPPDEYEQWLMREAAPAALPQNASDEQGLNLFLSSGCGGCHAIRGTAANGTIGPDLTHVGSRTSLAAATLRNDQESLARWITDNQHIKPENRMPAFGIFSPAELNALSGFLAGLR
jgi:cytochrome c oxidase subunit II